MTACRPNRDIDRSKVSLACIRPEAPRRLYVCFSQDSGLLSALATVATLVTVAFPSLLSLATRKLWNLPKRETSLS
jgi:hypothetical protein